MKTPWQTRAETMRGQGHTLVFIAAQIARTFLVPQVDVIAYLTRIEREREMRRGDDAGD